MSSLSMLAPVAAQAVASSAGEEAAFWICGTLAVVGALGLVLSRRAVHGALFVALTMINLAILYAANSAPFLGLVQVIVYTGAVMMLFLFVLMIVGVDASDSFTETIKAQRGWTAVLVLGFSGLLIAGIVTGMAEMTSLGLTEANEAAGGNAQGLAYLIFDRYLLAFQAVAALLITAALGALVLAHREHLQPRKTQADLSRERFSSGRHPGVLPNPGVLSSTNAIGNPALLPDGTPSQESIPMPLRAPSSPGTDEGQSAIERGED